MRVYQKDYVVIKPSSIYDDEKEVTCQGKWLIVDEFGYKMNYCKKPYKKEINAITRHFVNVKLKMKSFAQSDVVILISVIIAEGRVAKSVISQMGTTFVPFVFISVTNVIVYVEKMVKKNMMKIVNYMMKKKT